MLITSLDVPCYFKSEMGCSEPANMPSTRPPPVQIEGDCLDPDAGPFIFTRGKVDVSRLQELMKSRGSAIWTDEVCECRGMRLQFSTRSGNLTIASVCSMTRGMVLNCFVPRSI